MIDEWDNVNANYPKLNCNCAWVATAILGGAVVGGAAQIYGANKAANAQTTAANNAANLQLQMYNQTNANLAPYRNVGNQAAATLGADLPNLIAPINMSESQLEQ